MNCEVYSQGKKVSDAILLKSLDFEIPGVFETLRTYRGKIFRLQDHLIRFLESAKTAGVKLPLEAAGLKAELEGALAAFRKKGVQHDVFLRLTLFGGRIWVLAGPRKYARILYRKGVALETTAVRKSHTNAAAPEAKTSAYQNQVSALLEVPRQAYEQLFLDARGYVAEVRVGNLFIVKGNELLTPPPEGILNGITRVFVIKCGLRSGMAVKEIPLTRHDVYNADEAFLTNTSWGILPVRSLDGRRIGKRLPGEWTRRLQLYFTQRW